MKESISIYKNGVCIRRKNKRILFEEKDEVIIIGFMIVDLQGPGTTAIQKTHRGKMRETIIKISKESMDDLAMAYIEYLKNKIL